MSGSSAATLAALAVVPLILLTLTSFVKLNVVLSLLRNAIGAPEAPSSLVVTGLSLVLTVFVMAPVASDMIAAARAPATQPAPKDSLRDLVPAEYQGDVDAVERAEKPLADWLGAHAGTKDKATFVELATKLHHAPPSGRELWVIAPAFVTTELREAFAIAVLIFVPFLVIDLVVGIGLGALGLNSTNPQTVALPLKLALFVAVDGWRLLIDALLRGYA